MKPLLGKGFGIGGRIARSIGEAVNPIFPFGTNEYWMEQAILVGMESIGLSSPNPAVGCLLVQDNQIVGKGSTREWKREHAERIAFSSLDPEADLHRTTAYVTLEPCAHQGNQPPCVELLLSTPIPKIVIAVRDPDPRVNGEGIRRLQASGKEVVLGVLESEARAWNLNFFINRRRGRPIWAAKWAETPSGHLCDSSGHSKWITGPKSRAYTHWLRQKYDAIVVGARTFLNDQPALTVRDCAEPHNRNPMRFVFDPKGSLLGLPEEKRAGFKFLVCESEVLARGWAGLEGLIPVPISLESSQLWDSFCQILENCDFPTPLEAVLVEGGPHLLSELFKHDRFDVVHRFTGRKEFQSVSDGHRIQWSPSQDWTFYTEEVFDGDLLHEWVKEV